MSASIVLFRAGDESDPYEAALREVGFLCESLPVLRFEFVHETELRQELEHPRRYDGLVLTSPRAVEALTNAMSWLPTENVLWHAKSIFAVGPRTAADLRKIGFDPRGEESGSAEKLAEYIAQQNFERPLLFLCGNQRRDTLPAILGERGISFEELYVYESRSVIDLNLAAHRLPDWAAFFSPSGVEAVQADGGWDLTRVRLATIGDTTAEALRAEGFTVDVVATKPTPDSLAQALLAAEKRTARSR